MIGTSCLVDRHVLPGIGEGPYLANEYVHQVDCGTHFVVWLSMSIRITAHQPSQDEGARIPLAPRRGVIHLSGLLCLLLTLAGCINEFSVLSASGSPLLISRRGYSAQDCTEKVKDEAARMGVTLRYIHVRGNTAGRSLLWPFHPGYACEAAVGPEESPIGTYPETPPISFRGS